ncbi:MAG: transglycosylase domain-containing protein [Myxococcota bacterium]|nr:transglycosylase domain-containing protein [Myxococcota bacterium]
MSRIRRLGAFLGRWTLRLGLASTIAALVGVAVGAVAYKRHVIDEPGEHISEEYIMSVIARESPVLHRDGQTPIGVFFAQEHRQYVPYSELPREWVQAIIAAEDKRFFTHLGIDPEGIARAMRQNIKAGRVVSGGSTLTQQTTKNIYYRPDRSLRSKWEEMVNALRLERHHSKEKILELYANQFHVSANGRGLGIAARYFFNKDVAELDLLESAFLAGMVKGPANYDPFIARSEERREAALSRAQGRTRYVVDRMLVAGALDERERVIGAISESEHAALTAELERRFAAEDFFSRGRFRYDSHILLDEVEARLAEAPFPALFEELGIDNPSTAGIQVVTTIDTDAQREATYGLWNHLTTVGPVLESLAVADLIIADPPALDLHNPPGVHEFRTARVAGQVDGEITLDLGSATCVVDGDGLTRMATTMARARKGERWRKASTADIAALRDGLPTGSAVWSSLREEGKCDLEIRPELQGAVMVLEDGRIRAMVGGNDNRNFNRAVTAKRQLGSTWKPLVYAAGLQLNWAPTDPLDNRAWGFPFEGIWYYPRAAHQAPDLVSLAWAGTHSENLSSIWLLYHLTDRLSPAQFEELTKAVGLSRMSREPGERYLVRIRDDNGVISTRSRYPLFAFTAAKLEVAAELEAEDPQQALELRSMLYGSGAEKEEARVRKAYGGDNERRRIAAINNDFLRIAERGERCAVSAAELTALSEDAAAALEEANSVLDSVERLRSFRLFGGDAAEAPAKDVAPLMALEVPLRAPAEIPPVLSAKLGENGLSLACAVSPPEGFAAITAAQLDAISRGALAVDADEMRVDGRISMETIEAVQRSAKRRELVLGEVDPYDLTVLQYHPDFRILVGIRYVSLMAKQLGVAGEIPPVLSMPLGSTDISLEEAASMYEGLLTGQRFDFPGQKSRSGAVPGSRATEWVASQSRATQLIAQIRDRDGNVLYQASPEPVEVSDPVSGQLTGGILSNVIRWGTGRRAQGAVTLDGVEVPLFGKTGTTNSYRNAAFCGYVPAIRDGQWSWSDGFTVAVYVGYDDNRKMSRGSMRLAGSSGALPPWIVTARGLADAGLLGKEAPSEPLSFGEHYATVPVAEGSGLPLADGEADSGRSVLVWGRSSPWEDTHTMERRFSALMDPDAVSPVSVSPTEAAAELENEAELEDVWIPEMDAP